MQGLAEANGGSVDYERKDGRSRFVLCLPAGDADASDAGPQLASPTARQP